MMAWRALCRREWLEHRVALGWAPAGLLLLFVLGATLAATFSGETGTPMGSLAFRTLAGAMVKTFTWLYLAAAVLVLLATLIDERKDRSILFWRSMPVTDTATVMSKLFAVCVIGSAISVVAIISAQCYALLLASLISSKEVMQGDADFSALSLAGNSAVNWTAGYLSQIFWLLPLWGWLLLVSSLARSLTPFWAVAVPAVGAFLEWLVFRTDYVISSVLRHIDLRALPTHIGEHSSEGSSSTSSIWDSSVYLPQLAELWSSNSMWLGILTGCLLIAAAIYFRGRGGEL